MNKELFSERSGGIADNDGGLKTFPSMFFNPVLYEGGHTYEELYTKHVRNFKYYFLSKGIFIF